MRPIISRTYIPCLVFSERRFRICSLPAPTLYHGTVFSGRRAGFLPARGAGRALREHTKPRGLRGETGKHVSTAHRKALMTRNRMEAFSDGVFAIIITIMVLELKVPHGAGFADLREDIPVFLGYVLSFLYVGIYWTNHHHLLAALESVNGRILWVNLHLLFWLSLIPVSTAWAGEHPLSSAPTCVYGVILLMCALAYMLLERMVANAIDRDCALARSIRSDPKTIVSMVAYAAGAAVAVWVPPVAYALYCVVALLWIIPDMRIEKMLAT